MTPVPVNRLAPPISVDVESIRYIDSHSIVDNNKFNLNRITILCFRRKKGLLKKKCFCQTGEAAVFRSKAYTSSAKANAIDVLKIVSLEIFN